MVGLVLWQGLPQMILIPDQGAVEKLAAASADPAFGYRVHAGGPHVAGHGPDPGLREDRGGRGAGRPLLRRMDLGPERRPRMSRCQRKMVSGVTSSRSPGRRALGITPSRI